MSKFRAWVFTINNYTEDDKKKVLDLECQAIVAGLEVGEEGTPHIQGAVYFKSQKTLTAVKKSLPRAHLAVMRGQWEDQKYCEKEGNLLRKEGKGPEQGKRTDLDGLKRKLDEGEGLAGCFEENFALTVQYYKGFEKYEDIINRKKYRTEMTEGEWYHGETMTGKSEKAFLGYDPETVYLWTDDGGWWDGYTGQPVVVMNDFRGQVPFNEMLNLCDKWPHKVRRRGREPAPFLAKKVIVTSSLHPEDIYKKREAEDSMEQLRRRFVITKFIKWKK